MLNEMAKMCQPLRVSKGLLLANTLIEGTEWEQRLLDFKMKQGWRQFDEKGEKKKLLGKKGYTGASSSAVLICLKGRLQRN